MKIYAISDTHNQHELIKCIPSGDIVIHAGDATNLGKESKMRSFLRWFSSLNFKFKIFVTGNHDWICERQPSLIEAYAKKLGIIFLDFKLIEIENLKVFGYPYTPWCGHWAYMLPRGGIDLNNKINNIPENLDILISHGPPKNILDKCSGGNVGCELLRNKIEKVKPKIMIFGHIHESFGYKENEHTKFYKMQMDLLK